MGSSNYHERTTISANAAPPAARRRSLLKRSHRPSLLKDQTRLLPFRQRGGDDRDVREYADQLGLATDAYFSQDGTQLGPNGRDLNSGICGNLTQFFPRQERRREPALCRDKPKNSASSLSEGV